VGVTVSVPLFAEVGRELGEGTALQGRQLRDLSAELAARLLAAADVLDRLAADGWSARVALYDVLLSHPQVTTREQAEGRLRAQEVDPEKLLILEDVEDEEGEPGA
jgi:hypothetical protein